MNRLTLLLRDPAFHFFLFGVALALVSWPFLAVAAGTGLIGLYSYLYLQWGGLVLLLFLVARHLGSGSGDGETGEEGGDPGV